MGGTAWDPPPTIGGACKHFLGSAEWAPFNATIGIGDAIMAIMAVTDITFHPLPTTNLVAPPADTPRTATGNHQSLVEKVGEPLIELS